MSILVNKDTRLVVQGITGKFGSFHARQMLAYGTEVVAGVTPGAGGSKFDATDHLGAIREHLLRLKRAELAGDALHHQTRVPIDEDCHRVASTSAR